MNLIGISNYEENKEIIKEKLNHVNKKQTIIAIIVFSAFILVFVVLTGIGMYGANVDSDTKKWVYTPMLLLIIFFAIQSICESREYKNDYRINDLRLVEAAMTGNIASITTRKDTGARSTLVYYIVETKTDEKIITRNGLIKPTIHSGDTTETTFDLDKLELDIYM